MKSRSRNNLELRCLPTHAQYCGSRLDWIESDRIEVRKHPVKSQTKGWVHV